MDERDRQDGYVLGVMARLQFDREACPAGYVPFDLLVLKSNLFAPLVRLCVDSLIQRGLVQSDAEQSLFQLTPQAVHLVQHRRDHD